ncbi:hypothetical protein LX16_2701 [Stackebrandtia albiflava]|uniref:Uncharacterized protein n=1 Tax=Stackebrandtia albiflava TaxID=406432 RepID=A0A562V254_9ACTN|nr:hypothetical protein LX16_2701 [Stackebrandtia albiflava]
MSWCSITSNQQTTRIARAERIRALHGPGKRTARRAFRRHCTECGQHWHRTRGCAPYLWATDYLSSLSRVVYPRAPKRPAGRHRPTYTRTLRHATKALHELTRPTTPANAGATTPTPARPVRTSAAFPATATIQRLARTATGTVAPPARTTTPPYRPTHRPYPLPTGHRPAW